jgi:hypothetical protein
VVKKLTATAVLRLCKKLKQKKFQKDDFLILFLNLKNLIFFLIKSSKNYKIIFKNHGFLIEKFINLGIKFKIKKSSFWIFFVNFLLRRLCFIFFFEKDSRLGPRRLRSLSRYLLKIAV